MKGEKGRHQADALLANFSHVIVHASDPVTAKWASSKLGRRKEILYSGSSSPGRIARPATSCSATTTPALVVQ